MLSQTDLLTRDPNELYITYDLGIPVDLDKLLEALKINLNDDFDFDKLGYSGEIYWEDDRVNIWVNPMDIEQRRRFTIAHEIGHFILHMLPHIEDKSIEFKDDIKNLRRSDIWDAKEYEANNFAARLLMPKSAIMEGLLKIAEEDKKNERFEEIVDSGEIELSEEETVVFLQGILEEMNSKYYNEKVFEDSILIFLGLLTG